MTTIAGLLPLMTERSFQAQLLIPMATSLAFGLMLATFLVLLLIPVFYLTYQLAHDHLRRSASRIGMSKDNRATAARAQSILD